MELMPPRMFFAFLIFAGIVLAVMLYWLVEAAFSEVSRRFRDKE